MRGHFWQRIAAMSTMIAAADEYSRLKSIGPVEPESMSAGYTTMCDPCLQPRKIEARNRREEKLRPEQVEQPRYPADAEGNALTMELRPCVPPPSSVPYLRQRFYGSSVDELMHEHDGKEEPLTAASGRRHLERGWTKRNDRQFRQNEEMLRRLFGDNWDARYGRTRVKSAHTGEYARAHSHSYSCSCGVLPPHVLHVPFTTTALRSLCRSVATARAGCSPGAVATPSTTRP